MEAGELRPMSEAEAAALRARLLELRAASKSGGAESQLTARTAYEQLAQEEAFKAFATSGRVKKAWTRINAERREAAAKCEAARSPAVADGLPLWPAGKSIVDALDKGDTCIFTMAEKLQSLSNVGGLPIGKDAELDFKQTLHHMASHLERGVDFFLLEDEGESSAVVLLVLSVRAQAIGLPLYEVEFAHQTRAGAGLAAHVAMVQSLVARGKPAVKVKASLEEQALFLERLEQNAVRGAACVHPVLRRSCVASPPPAAKAELSERPPPGLKVCAFCSGAARLTCAGCRGAHYCDAACQKRHWKAHRPDCKGESKPDDASVVINVAGREVGGLGAFININVRQGAGARVGAFDAVAHNPHGARRFVIKAQVSQTGGTEHPIMLYDEPRALHRMLFCDEGEAAFHAVRNLVRARGVLNGAKAYLWAKREGAHLRIFVDAAGMPDQQQPW